MPPTGARVPLGVGRHGCRFNLQCSRGHSIPHDGQLEEAGAGMSRSRDNESDVDADSSQHSPLKMSLCRRETEAGSTPTPPATQLRTEHRRLAKPMS